MESTLVAYDEPTVLLIDEFERVQSLEGWLRNSYLPRVRAGTVVVAGELPPSDDWTFDIAWQDLLRVPSA